ncbi:TetR/AcrR family transcriptional regulator [Noviherbaspirillum sp.]|uniref:TetR/AcrR family transcriptional regulator n=1 Tax=Noviherbaspirillum sp. TaxID=1926288 RepID=UPI002FE003A3
MPKKTLTVAAAKRQAASSEPDPRRDRRTELLQHALECLSTKGYAQTTLRDIASESGMSLGRLYYYFESKEDLITMVVCHYKEQFMVSMLSSFNGTETVEEMLAQVIDEYIRTIQTSARTHRLWYDIRMQAMFDEKFRAVVNPIQDGMRAFFPALIKKISALLGNATLPGVDPEFLYLMTDALFFRALQDDVTSNKVACKRFRTSLEELFDSTLLRAAREARAAQESTSVRPSSRRRRKA